MRGFFVFTGAMTGIAGAGIGGFLGKLLLISGIVSLIVFAMPWLIVMGLFLLIVPGVLLMLAPNVFLWASVFAIAFYPLRAVIGDLPAAVAAAAFAIATLYYIPAAAAAEGDRRFAELKLLPDVKPAETIRLEGDILLVQPAGMSRRSLQSGKKGPNDPGRMCNSLCAAMLFTDGVTSVSVMDDKNAPVTFRLKPRGRCAVPIDLPKPDQFEDSLGVDWAARLERGLCIDREDGMASQPSLRIDIGGGVLKDVRDGQWSFGPYFGRTALLEIRRGDELLMRSSGVEFRRIARPLHIVGDGGLENWHLQWGRKKLKDGIDVWNFSPHKQIAEVTTLRTGVTVEEARDQARAFIAEALEDPSRPLTDAVAGMVPTYFASFANFRQPRGSNAVTDRDIDLLKAMLEDPRFTIFDRSYHMASETGDRIVELRDPLVARLLTLPPGPDSHGELSGLNAIFLNQPPGAFATLTTGEETLLADRQRRGILPGLIVRLSDQGPGAVPRLLTMLRESRELIARHRADRKQSGPAPSWAEKIAQGATTALRRLGPEASAALPEIERMVAEGLIPAHDAQRDEFLDLLVRLGKPVEQIRKPDNRGGTEAQFQDRLRRRAERYNPDRDR